MLIEARCNMDLQMQDGCTPFYLAVQSGHGGVTKQLFQTRCNIDAQNKNGSTPLFISAERGHATVTEMLIEAALLLLAT